MTTATRVRDYLAIIRDCGPRSHAARNFLNRHSGDMEFLAYATAINREHAATDDKIKNQKSRT